MNILNSNSLIYKSTSFTQKKKHDVDVSAEDVGAGAVAAAVVPTTKAALRTTNKGLQTATKVAKQGNIMIDAMPKNSNKYKNLLLDWIKSAEKSVVLRPFAKLAMSPAVRKIAGAFGGIIAVAFCIADIGNIFNASTDLAKNYKK